MSLRSPLRGRRLELDLSSIALFPWGGSACSLINKSSSCLTIKTKLELQVTWTRTRTVRFNYYY
ncbi:hypothetical protein BJX76DRAFT_343103 [Aspergillus varians]